LLPFMEFKGSATGSYPKLDKSSPHPPIWV
jgi:hypothetical protein